MSTDPYQHTEVGTEQSRKEFADAARASQVVGVALLLGCLSFAMVALFTRGVGSEIYEGASVITWMGLGMGCIMGMNSIIIPIFISRREGNSLNDLLGIFRKKTIVGMALCEAASFFNLIAYIIDGQLLSLGIVVLLMLRLGMQIPSAGALEGWVMDRTRTVQQGF